MSDSNPMIVVTGGGSGGHITPVLAVADAIKHASPAVQVVYIGQRGDKLGDLGAGHATIDHAYVVSAGKFRRYHGLGWRQIFKVRTMLLNIRDAFRVIAGIVQSVMLLRRLRPSVIFIKGGFVGVPVGLAAAWLGIPFVTHDSDALPGLANRIVAKWAQLHTVAMPKDIYPYPPEKTITVGVPIAAQYSQAGPAVIVSARQTLGLSTDALVVLIAGGGLGSRVINQALEQGLVALLQEYPKLTIVQQAGRAHVDQITKHYDSLLTQADRKRVRVVGYVSNMHDYVAAADLVVTRAGATNLTELAVAHRACIVVPNPYLTGGHQLANARVLADRDAVELLEETAMTHDPRSLSRAISRLLNDPGRREALSNAISAFAVQDASTKLAHILLDFCTPKSGSQ